MQLVGLKKVKQSAVALVKNALVLSTLDAQQRKHNSYSMNYCFMGNPGTGKTTVARLLARVLQDAGLRPNHNVVETTAQELKDKGADEFRQLITKATGGVLVIDEAYELDPAGDFKGKPIVAELLTAAEDKRDALSIILAGYEDDIQKKLYAYNDGLRSRFEEILFEDLDEEDLGVVWDRLASAKGWSCDAKVRRIACTRLARGAHTNGNARAARQLFEQAAKAAMSRDDFCQSSMALTTRDLLGDRPTSNPKLQRVLAEVEAKTGWRSIKQAIRELVQLADKNYERELQSVPALPLALNRLLLGNPGTGKTTCAALYGQVLKHLHFLSSGDVVLKVASDFIGAAVGQSQTKAVDILKSAKGKVLVIDEAYSLNDGLYGKQVLDVLVEKVQGSPSDDIAVLLLGYEPQMLEMIRTQNPGLARRFPPQYAFRFDDYDDDELLEIFEAACEREHVAASSDVAELVLQQLGRQRALPNFGNAGAVHQLLRHAMAKATLRDGDRVELRVEDVVDKKQDEEGDEEDDPLALLDALYRIDHVKAQLRSLQAYFEVSQSEGGATPDVGHFVFRGSPGTGKTTVARVMATILHRMGLLGTDRLVETSGLDLTGEFVESGSGRPEAACCSSTRRTNWARATLARRP